MALLEKRLRSQFSRKAARRVGTGARWQIAEPAKSTALEVLNPDLRTNRGNLSIKLISDLFGFSVAEIGRLIGKTSRAALSKTPDADSLQDALRPFSDIAMLRLAVPGDDAFRKWLRAPNEYMKGRAPVDWIREGSVRNVAGFVFSAMTGQAT